MTDQINLGLIWADDGGVTPVTATKYEGGWVAEIPHYQNFNYMVQGLDKNILHFAESNSYNWQDDISYKAGARVVSPLGFMFTARANSLAQDPDTDPANSTWVHGWIVGSNFGGLLEADGFKVELPERPNYSYTGVDQVIVNRNPMIELRTTGTTANVAVGNVQGELVAHDLGQNGPDGRGLGGNASSTHRIFHEGHYPLVAEVVGAIPDSPTNGAIYGRSLNSWVAVTSTTVSDAPPPAVLGGGQGWYNLADGQFYVDISDGDSSQWVPASPPLIPELPDPVRSTLGSAHRNLVITPDPLSGSTISSSGFSAAKYSGNGLASYPIDNGLDMSTGDFGGLVWIKDRTSSYSHRLFDTVRGVEKELYSNSDDVELSSNTSLLSFNSNGFTLGSYIGVNNGSSNYVSWSWSTTKKITGVTNRGKAYTSHYNPSTGFSIVGYIGDGSIGHEIPHHLSSEPELTITRPRFSVSNWFVTGPTLLGVGNYLLLNGPDASAYSSSLSITNNADNNVLLTNSNVLNGNLSQYISYNFTSVEGYSKVGKYTGTGASGNYIDLGFKPAFVMLKNRSTGGTGYDWFMFDVTRGENLYLDANSSHTEASASALGLVETGFVLGSAGAGSNTLNHEYVFLAFAASSYGTSGSGNDWNNSTYDRPLNGNQVTIKDGAIISYANGFDINGESNDNQLSVGDTLVTLPAGSEDTEVWIYKDKDGNFGTTTARPLEGIARIDADKWGLVSPVDATLRTTARHYTYKSSTGVASASGEVPPNAAYSAFNKDGNDIVNTIGGLWNVISTGASWLQYKQTEKRVLKSWRLREMGDTSYSPRRFTIEGSNDETTWVTIDSTYASSNYVGNGVNEWGDLQEESQFVGSSNVTAYLYHRISITANNGHNANTQINELEFNTVLLSDYYLINEGVMHNSTGSPILRTYLGSVLTDTDGDIFKVISTPVKTKGTDAEYHGDVVVHGDLVSRGSASAWVTFGPNSGIIDVVDSYNVADVVYQGTGSYKIVFEKPMEVGSYSVSGTTSYLSSTTGPVVLERNTSRVLEYVIVYSRYSRFSNSYANPVIVDVAIHGGIL